MLGEVAALATALLWSWTALFFTAAGRMVGSFAVNQIRLMFGAILLLTTFLIINGDFTVTDRGLYSLMLSGLIGLLAGDLALFRAFTILGARRSMLIMALAPALTAILAYFFLDESLGIAAMVGIAITLGGIYWVLAEPKEKQDPVQGNASYGILMAVLGAVFQALGLIVAKYGLNDQKLDPLYATLIRMITALSASLLVMILRHKSAGVIRAFHHRRAMLFLGLGSIVGPFLGVWMSMVSIKYAKTGVGATIMSTTPVLIIPFSIIFQKERPSFRAILGTGIAVAGIAVLFWR